MEVAEVQCCVVVVMCKGMIQVAGTERNREMLSE